MNVNDVIVLFGSIGIILIMGTFLIIMNALTSKKKQLSKKQWDVSFCAGENLEAGSLVSIGSDGRLYKTRFGKR